jgi:alanyl-tRNA synthetase
MTGNEIRRRFLEHFESREHLVLPSAPLVPQGDPSTLFISAGMQPLQPYYLGQREPPAPRLATCQKCFRTNDIDEVGRTDRHGTFFEMLGNFAPTGDYFKETAIPLAWELVTGSFDLPKDRLRVTIHTTDDEADRYWKELTDVRPEWITRLEDNWWGLDVGPCGPDSEIWWDRGPEAGCGQPDCEPGHCDRFTEIWNLVFPQFDKQPDGTLIPLAKPAIDTGMGLERIAYVLQGKANIFETDLLFPIIERIRAVSDKQSTLSERVVADHVRAACFLLAEGIVPTNEGRGYVLRRLIRRATLHGQRLGLREELGDFVATVVKVMDPPYEELRQRERLIREGLNQEAVRFQRTLDQGMQHFERLIARHPLTVPGAEAFKLHDTFGFPIDLTRELAAERGIRVDEEGFRADMAAQRERSRRSVPQHAASAKDLPRSEFTGYQEVATETRIVSLRKDGQSVDAATEGDAVEVFLERTPFYGESGGQVGDTGTITTPAGRVRVEDTLKPAEGVIAHIGTVVTGEISAAEKATAAVDAKRRRQIARHHSATHLLHKALRETLGEQVVQKGSWVGPDHTTFDIPFSRAITNDELKRINFRVMEKVRDALPFHESHKPYREAVADGAMHLFEEKYGDVVRVVCFGDWTCELCGGTHVTNSADVGTAVIVSESSIGSGLRRLDMVVGEAADDLVWRDREMLSDLARSFNVSTDQLAGRVQALRAQVKEKDRQLAKIQDDLRAAQVKGKAKIEVRPGLPVNLITERVEAKNHDELAAFADRLMESIRSGVVTVASDDLFVLKVSDDLTDRYDATRLRAHLGGGGGNARLVRGKLSGTPEEAFNRLEAALK